MAPSFGVEVAIINRSQILLTKRGDLPVWCLPGGMVEAGESLAQSAIRETLEETGLEVELTRLVGLYSRPNWGEGAHAILFAGRIIGGVLQRTTDETTDARYFAQDELPGDLLWWYRRRIADAFADCHAVARSQMAEWPFGIANRAEAYTRLQAGKLDVVELAAQFCSAPDAGGEVLEVG